MLYVTTRTELDYARQIVREYNRLRGTHSILEKPEFSFMFKNIERAIRKYDSEKIEFPTSEIGSD